MTSTTRVTVTLPSEVVEEIDRLENRSRFVLESVRRELVRRRRESFRRSLDGPHPEVAELAEHGLAAWSERLPQDEVSDLVDATAGTAIRWVRDEGWLETEE
jgi:Arc/MetJ-type ribon-helix-helix transcriptional regulator